jgi:hypothetical protein
MDYWPYLLPVSDLPGAYRLWALAPVRSTLDGSRMYALLVAGAKPERTHRPTRRCGQGLPSLTIDVRDPERFIT